MDFNVFGKIFLTQLAIKWLFKFPPHITSVHSTMH